MIWLDNAATTKPDPRVLTYMAEVANEAFGNPSSSHRAGLHARHILEEARKEASQLFHTSPDEVLFTAGGTISNNLAILGSVRPKNGVHVVTTAIEHDSVSEPMRVLKAKGVHITELVPDRNGVISVEDFEKAVTPETVLACVMYVNNETGAVQPIDRLSVILKRKAKDALFMVDAVQAAGKLPLYPSRWGVDLMTVSAHKFHGPRGIGALYLKKGARVPKLMYGGGQEKGVFPGTENVAGAAGLARAATLYSEDRSEQVDQVKQIIRRALLSLPNVTENGSGFSYILNLSFHGIPSEILLNALSAREICVSAGSACKTGKPSHAIAAMGGDAKSAIRFSFAEDTTQEEAQAAADAVREVVTAFRQGKLM